MEQLQLLDEYFFRVINSNGWSMMDDIMVWISSKWLWVPLYLYILYLLFKEYKESFIKILFAIGALVFVADYGSVHLFKDIFERLRPCHILEGIRVVDGCGGQYGFVSSHASNAFALAFFVPLLLRKRLLFIILFSWAVLIGFSRVYLGVHYPFDIVGGMFWALFVSLLIYYIYCMKMKTFDWIWVIWLGLICLWNFGWPEAPPIADILIAVILSLFVIAYREIKK